MSIRHFINLPDIGPDTLKGILEHAHALKRDKYNPPQILEGLSLVMAFDKRSTRTRLSFEVAMKQLGGHTIVMNMGEMQIAGSRRWRIRPGSLTLRRCRDAADEQP